MFSPEEYSRRRRHLTAQLASGLALFLGHEHSPMNYAANVYPFRQDSSFLYYWGLDFPGLAAMLDLDSGDETLFGRELTMDDRIWIGDKPSLDARAEQVGMAHAAPRDELKDTIRRALQQNRTVHFLPLYRAETRLRMAELLGASTDQISDRASPGLIEAVIDQRSIKNEEEVAEIEQAVEISGKMHTLAMRMTAPGVTEQEIAGAMEGVAISHDGRLSFPAIFSVNGEVLHNAPRPRPMKAGDLALHDAGATSPRHYAGDITRVTPVSGRFTERQRDVYQIVLDAQVAAIDAIRPDIPYREIHLQSARHMTEGLKALGLMKGDADEAVAAGAHAIFFPHGLGHMMGLDVHDMEALGEDNVGYDDEIGRSDQFGLSALRLGRRLKEGFVLTVEPGIYFIPALIDQWKSEGKHTDFIDYERFDDYKDFGGIRIEDDVLVTESGCRVLGRPIPKTIKEVEATAADR